MERLLQLHNNRTGYRVGDTEAGAQIFKRVAECIKGRGNIRPGRRQTRHIRPFANDAVGALARLDHIDFLQAGPIGLNASVCIEKFLLAPRLDPEPNDIERSHRDTSLVVSRSSRCARHSENPPLPLLGIWHKTESVSMSCQSRQISD
jgi:hypothetical protein